MPSMGWAHSSRGNHTRRGKRSNSQKLILLMELIYTDERGGIQTISLWKNISNGTIFLSCSRPPRRSSRTASNHMPLLYSGTECPDTKRFWAYFVEWDGPCPTSPQFGIKVKLD